VYNSISEYTTTTNISTVINMPFYVKPFEKKVFEEVTFFSNIIKTLKSSRDGAEKKGRKVLKKEKERKTKKRKKKKSSMSLFK
jgi:hypothetical protein